MKIYYFDEKIDHCDEKSSKKKFLITRWKFFIIIEITQGSENYFLIKVILSMKSFNCNEDL